MHTFLCLFALFHATLGPPSSRPASAPAEPWRHLHVTYGRLDAEGLKECSGLVASRRSPGVYWALNDSGNPPQLFALDEFGHHLGVWTVAGTDNVDWEDLAIDDRGRLIIGEFGDNDRRRHDARLLIVPEPDDPRPRGAAASRPAHARAAEHADDRVLRIEEALPFRFPDGPQNCEALFAWDGKYYLIEKRGSLQHKPARPARLFRVPRGSAADAPPALIEIESFDFEGSVTAADIATDGRRLAVSTYGAVFVFALSDDKSRFFANKPHVTPMFCGQMESLSFHHDGTGDLLLASEQRQVFRLPRAWYERGAPYVPGARLSAAP